MKVNSVEVVYPYRAAVGVQAAQGWFRRSTPVISDLGSEAERQGVRDHSETASNQGLRVGARLPRISLSSLAGVVCQLGYPTAGILGCGTTVEWS